MKKILNILVAVALLANLVFIPAVVLAEEPLMFDDFERYPLEGTVTRDDLLISNDGAWTHTYDKSMGNTGEFKVILTNDTDTTPTAPPGKTETKVLRSGGNSTSNHYAQSRVGDFSGEMTTSFWVNMSTLDTNPQFIWRHGGSAGATGVTMFQKPVTGDKNVFQAFGKDIPLFTVEPNTWYFCEIVTDAFMSGDKISVDYSVYIDGVKYVDNDSFASGTAVPVPAGLTDMWLRTTYITSNASSFVYTDDVMITKDAFEDNTPTVSITSPADNDVVSEGDITVLIDAQAKADASIERAVLYVNGAEVGETSGNSFVWESDVPGHYELRCMVFDSEGRATVSAPVNITVEGKIPDTIVFEDDFDTYAPGGDLAQFQLANGGQWTSGSNQTQTGKPGVLDVVLTEDAAGERSKVLRIGAFKKHTANTDPLMDRASMDFSGRRIISFDAKMGSTDRGLMLQWRGNAGTATNNQIVFNKVVGEDAFRVFEQYVKDAGGEDNFVVAPGVWHHYVIDLTAYNEGGISKVNYSVYVDGEKLVDGGMHEGTKTATFITGFRITTAHSEQGYAYVDNLSVKDPSNVFYISMVQPQAAPVYQRNAIIKFSADIDPSTLGAGDISVTASKSRGGDSSPIAVEPEDIRILNDRVLIALSDTNLNFDTEYTVDVTLPEGIKDIFGRSLDKETNLAVSFTTAAADKEIGSYKVSGFRVAGGDGADVATMQTGTLTATADVERLENDIADLSFIIAWYDSAGALKDVGLASAVFASAGETGNVTTSIEVPAGEDITGHTVKVFVWSYDNLMPLDIILID